MSDSKNGFRQIVFEEKRICEEMRKRMFMRKRKEICEGKEKMRLFLGNIKISFRRNQSVPFGRKKKSPM